MQRGFIPILALIGIIMAVLAGGGYYFYQEQKYTNIDSFEDCQKAGFPVMESYPAQCQTPDGRNFVQSLSEEEKKKSESSDETLGWQVYQDNKLGYTIKYPSSVKIDRAIEGDVLDLIRVEDSDIDFRDRGVGLSIYFRGGKGQNPEEVFRSGECSEPCNEKTKKVQINNAIGITTLGPQYPYEDLNFYVTDLNKTWPIVRIFITSPLSKTQENLDDIVTFKKILSTFNFLDEEKKDEISNWRKYSNNRCNINLYIPPKNTPYYENGRYWQYLESEPINTNLFSNQVSMDAIYKSDNEEVYGAELVHISCAPNDKNYTNISLLDFYKDYLMRRGLEYKGNEKIVLWGKDILKVKTYSYYEGESYAYLLATSKHIYLLEVFDSVKSPTPFVQQTAKQIFNGVEFLD